MNRMRQFEQLIDDKLRALFRSPGQEGQRREMVEVHRAILDEVVTRIEELPRDRRIFPYSRVAVEVLVPEPARRRAYEVVFLEGDALARDIRARLEDEGCEMPPNFEAAVALTDDLPPDLAGRGFDIRYGLAAAPAAAKPAALPSATLTIVNGTPAGEPSCSLGRRRVNLGRLPEVYDAGRRLVRRNDLAFADGAEPPDSTVSRTHARIEWDGAAGRWRIFDERSAFGTMVARGGELITVPKGSSKGVALESGDEILLGQARVRFETQ